MAAKLFKGKDRRMITKLKKVITAIVNRDTIALNVAVKTQAISTRTLIFDGPTAPNPFYSDAQALLTRCNALLAMTR